MRQPLIILAVFFLSACGPPKISDFQPSFDFLNGKHEDKTADFWRHVNGVYENVDHQKFAFDSSTKTMGLELPQGSIRFTHPVQILTCRHHDPLSCYCESKKTCWLSKSFAAACYLDLTAKVDQVTYDEDALGFNFGYNVHVTVTKRASGYTSRSVEDAKPDISGNLNEAAKYACKRYMDETAHAQFSIPISQYDSKSLRWEQGSISQLLDRISFGPLHTDPAEFDRVKSDKKQ